MLPTEHRLRSSAEFVQTVRRGVRVGRPAVVVHALRRDDDGLTRVGFVVSKAVGGAVVRNRVKRRLRALSRPLVMAHPLAGCSVVVRALPTAATDPDRVPIDLVGAWTTAWTKVDAS